MEKKKIGLTKEQIKIGIPVRYYSWINEEKGTCSEALDTIITSDFWECGNEWVCKVEGISGGAFISHLELRAEESLPSYHKIVKRSPSQKK